MVMVCIYIYIIYIYIDHVAVYTILLFIISFQLWCAMCLLFVRLPRSVTIGIQAVKGSIHILCTLHFARARVHNPIQPVMGDE